MSNKYLGEDLIFIISQPRSGSTLLQRILFGHPDIQTSAETWLMLHPVYALRRKGIEAEYHSYFAKHGVKEFIENYTSGEEVYLDGIRAFANTIYKDAIGKNNKKLFLDKTPRYFFIIPELYTLFPKAKFIFLLRNPMAVLASELTTYVKEDWPVLGVFEQDLLYAPDMILKGIDLLGDNGYVIQYEQFVNDPKKSTKALCEFMDIPFVTSMLDYSNTPQPKGKMNDPTGISKHTSPSKSSVDKWKKMLESPQSLYFAQQYLKSLGKETLDKLGYSYDDIYGTLSSTKINPKGLYPWDIAIRPKERWTRMEHFKSDLYFSRKEFGYLQGTISAFSKHFRPLLRSLKYQASCPDAIKKIDR